jgi:RNA polymerase sigma-70 factor (ECF subfamily)
MDLDRGIARLDGRETFFSRLYQEDSSYVRWAFRRLGVPERDLPDVTHDLFVVVFRRLDTYDRSRPSRPWLFGIAFRLASDYRRSARAVREVLGESPDVVNNALGADDHVAASQDRDHLIRILDHLDIKRRAVVLLHDFEGRPASEIAATLEIPLGTVYSRLRLARKDLTEALKRVYHKGSFDFQMDPSVDPN